MSTLLAPPGTQPPAQVTPPPTPLVATDGPTPRRFLTGYASTLLVPLAALVASVTSSTLLSVHGWPTTTGAVAGWGLAVAAWLHRRGWPAARAHLAAWAAPAALLVPLAPLGWLTPAGLPLWGPVSAVLGVALAAAHHPDLVSRPSRAHRPR
jgi:hypothetical protein